VEDLKAAIASVDSRKGSDQGPEKAVFSNSRSTTPRCQSVCVVVKLEMFLYP